MRPTKGTTVQLGGKDYTTKSVDLDDVESLAKDLFDYRLDQGDDIPTAVSKVRSFFLADLSDEFYTWLGR